MKGMLRKAAPILLAVLALSVLSAGLLLAMRDAQPVQASAPEELAAPSAMSALVMMADPHAQPKSGIAADTLAQRPDNSQCLACHGRPDQVYQYPNGDVVSISVDPEAYDQSQHAALACTNCHTNITGYPHPPNPANSAREYTLLYANSCRQCHPGQAQEIMDSAHAQLPPEQMENAPVCADCHNPHVQPPIQKDANGDPLPVERPNIAVTCSKCHAGIVEEYRNSVHGAALFGESNPDVPACNDCHGIHNITQASTIEFRLNSPELCATCHTREDIMGKYDLSTHVLNTYVADFHGTTVTLFSKERSGQDTNKPVCYDCHGVHNIVSVNDPEKGIAVKQNMLLSCQRCHPDASDNFPASWMSHYIPSPERYPLVYFVNLFYNIFIPVVLGGMGLFVLSDILNRMGVVGRKKRAAGQADHTTKE